MILIYTVGEKTLLVFLVFKEYKHTADIIAQCPFRISPRNYSVAWVLSVIKNGEESVNDILTIIKEMAEYCFVHESVKVICGFWKPIHLSTIQFL